MNYEIASGKDINGNIHPLLVDATTGALQVVDAALPVQTTSWGTSTPTQASGSIIAGTGANGILQSVCGGFDTVIVTANVTQGTVTAGTIYFEVWDGAAWLPIKVPRIESYTTDTAASLVGTNSISFAQQHAWQVPVAGFPQYRTRLSASITGSGTPIVVIAHLVSSAPDVSIVTAGLDPNQAVIPQAPTITVTTGTATAGTGATIVLAAGVVTKYLDIQNTAVSGTLYVGIGATATNSMWAIAAGQHYQFPVLPQQAIYLLGSASVTYCILSA